MDFITPPESLLNQPKVGTPVLHQPEAIPSTKQSLPSHQPKSYRSSHRGRIFLIIGVVLIGILGGAYVAFSQGYVSLAWMPDIPYVTPKPSTFLNSFFDSTDTTNSIEYGYRFSASVADRKNGAEPLFNSVNSNLPDSPISLVAEPPVILKAIPADLAINGEMSMGVESNQTAAQAKFWMAMKGSYSGAGKAHQLDLEIRKTDDGLYGVINKFPTLPTNELFDISKVQSQWIEIASGATMSNLLSAFQDQADTQNDALKKLVKEQEAVITKILDAKVFSITRPLPFLGKKLAGAKTNQYTIRLVPQNVPAAYRAVIEEFKRTNKDTDTLEDQLKEMEKPDNMAMLKRLTRQTRVDVWLEAETGYLRRVLMTLNIVPPDAATNLKDKQVNVELEMTMGKINQPLNVTEPNSSVDLEEAVMTATGASAEEMKFMRQISRVENVRVALMTYHDQNNSYPGTLTELDTELRKMAADCEAKINNSNTNSDSNINIQTSSPTTFSIEPIGSQLDIGGSTALDSFNCLRFVDGVKVADVYTNQPYGYTRDEGGGDYKLTYQITYFDGATELDKDTYIEGQNTASKIYKSVEKQGSVGTGPAPAKDTDGDYVSDPTEAVHGSDLNKTDTDGDGLNDYNEIFVYNTKPALTDSDADGYADKQEIDGGYNPNGSGQATSTVLEQWRQRLAEPKTVQ